MLVGLLLCLATGVVWTLVGVFYSLAAQRNSEGYVSFMATNSLIFVGSAWLFGLPPAAPAGEIALTGLCALAAALVGQLGMLMLNLAMRRGGHGTAWAISQSSLVIPFFVGVLFLGNRLGWTAFCGVLAVLGAIALIGWGSARGEQTGGRYVGLALAALLGYGVGQSLTLVPGHLNLSSAALAWRVPIYSLGALSWWGVLVARREKFQFAWLGVAYGAVVAAGQFLFYRASDCLEREKASGLAYPLAVGTCILLMRLYSRVVRREKFTWPEVVGLAILLAGVVLLGL